MDTYGQLIDKVGLWLAYGVVGVLLLYLAGSIILPFFMMVGDAAGWLYNLLGMGA